MGTESPLLWVLGLPEIFLIQPGLVLWICKPVPRMDIGRKIIWPRV